MSIVKTKNLLLGSERYQLCRYLENRKEHAARTPAAVLAEQAAAQLGFRVIADNVRSARRDVGIERILPPSGRSVQTARDLRAVAAAVAHLYRKIGCETPEELVRIAWGKGRVEG